MAKDQNGSLREIREKSEEEEELRRKSKRKSKEDDSESESEEVSSRSDSEEEERKHSRRTKHHAKKKRSSKKKQRKRYSDEEESESDSERSSEESEEEERRRRRRKRRREERDRRSRRREKDRKRREKETSEDRKRRKKEEEKKKSKAKKGAVTDSWGKYGVLRETDMWNKRPEFTAWLAEVKQVNLESLANWEEKQMFKEFMEDHNTATFPSKKYYNLDAYHRRKIEKEIKKGSKKGRETERTVFNDEEQRRLELLREREKQKEEEVEALKHSMQSGMAQAMKEQAQLREEMAYQYKLGNFEAAAAIQRRLDPDVAM